jgi:hypothetical protein
MEMPSNNQTTPVRDRLEWFWYAASAIIALICAITNLYYPFVADQVVALSGAKAIAEGGILYVDFWDNKMPGLFWFYFVAGELFGYTELGVHTLELIWMSSFALILMVTLRRYYCFTWLSALAPIAVISVYYVSSEPFLLTQLEIIVGLPIFLSAWLVAQHPPSIPLQRRLSFASGICAGITVVFKLVFAPLFVIFWLLASFHFRCAKNSTFAQIAKNLWVPASLGVVTVLGMVVGKFWIDGALDELLWTAFVYPPQALITSPNAPYIRLFESLRFFATFYFAWSGFIFIAIYHWWRSERDLITSLMIAWLIVGLGLILIQRFSWWQYHFLILFPPAGILAVRGISELTRYVVEASPGLQRRTMLLALTFVVPLVGAVAVPGGQKLTPYTVILLQQNGSIADVQKGINSDYAKIHRSTRFLVDKMAIPGAIYVLGDPLYYHLSGRRPALPIIGWPWKYFLQSQWEQVPNQLSASRTPYLYIDEKNKKMIEQRGGGVGEFIAEHYIRLVDDHNGSWLILRPEFRKKKPDT